MRCRLGLNVARKDNYVFFDPDAPLHLSLTMPVGYTNRVTASIVRGLKAGTIIDIDHVIDLEKRCFINVEASTQTEQVAPLQPGQIVEEQDLESVPLVAPTEEQSKSEVEQKPASRGKKKDVDETPEK